MIRCRLKVLMAEKRITQMELAAATGISRMTMTALANGKSKGIQFSTLERLCGYLGCDICELLVIQPKEEAAQP